MMETIKINDLVVPHPSDDIALERVPRITAMYTTLSGRKVGDIAGYEYKDVTLKWDWLDAETLSSIIEETTKNNGVFFLELPDVTDGTIRIEAMRNGLTAQETRHRDAQGNRVWVKINMDISFVGEAE